MSNKPKFSIIVPTYNQAEYLTQALDSILFQTDTDWEAIVVNDGSTDSTPNIMEEYAVKDPRFKIFHKDNGGVGSALNYGIRQSSGKWICWLSSDDYFDKRKLEIHRQWINKEPDTFFFHTHFYQYRECENQLELPPLWREIPEKKWQVVEMLRCTFINGISICISRDAINNVGFFNEQLLYGQDYDFWLRLLSKYHAIFIPKRTCIQRIHAQQTTNTFSEACYFDSARATIEFLNNNKFEKLFPFVDLSDRDNALQAIRITMDVASTFGSVFLYGLGPHPALLWRVLEWVIGSETCKKDASIYKYVMSCIKNVYKRIDLEQAVRTNWKAVYVALKLGEGAFEYKPINPVRIAEMKFWQLQSVGDVKKDSIYRYLENCGYTIMVSEIKNCDRFNKSNEVVMVAQKGAIVDKQIKYGAARALYEISRYLLMVGKQIILVGISEKRLGVEEGILFVGARSEIGLIKILNELAPIDTIIGISRIDVFFGRYINKGIVYQHNPCLPAGEFPSKYIKSNNVQVIVVSNHLKEQFINQGVPVKNLHTIYNGYDNNLFYYSNNIARAKYRIVFAGMGINYKGLDIAVQAFKIIKESNSKAELHIYGRNCTWYDDEENLWPSMWIDDTGFPNWRLIEKDLPGVIYYGEVTQEILANAFREASLLICPSRINETFGLVSIEAQGCGCIPILTKKGGFPETIIEGKTGYLLNDNTPNGIAQLIIELWNNDKPCEEQRLQASEWARKNFSWRSTGARINQIIDDHPNSTRYKYVINNYLWKLITLIIVIARNLFNKIKSPFLRKLIKRSLNIVRKV